jgi:hypothetical protein
LKTGDLAECAIWLDGTETDDMLRQWKADCAYMMAQAQDPVLKLGRVSFELKRPGEDRVPQVPDHLSGPDVRLLVGTAEVLGFATVRNASFVDGLDLRDLAKLRAATRRQHSRHISDAQCDQIIERLGPIAGAETIRRGPYGQRVH